MTMLTDNERKTHYHYNNWNDKNTQQTRNIRKCFQPDKKPKTFT